MGNVYLITGATSDVGVALIRRIFKEGDTLIAQGTSNLAALDPIKEAWGDAVHTFAVDLTDEAATQGFIAQVAATCPLPTHIVHLPALRVVNTRFRSFDAQRFEQDFSVQVRSAIQICKAFLPKMAKAKRGRVLFMQSSYTLGAPPKNTTAYVVAKSALAGLAKSLAVEYASSQITVNTVAPCMMETRFLADTPDLIVQASAADNPMGRNARVEDVVPAMAFLLSEEAGFITGVTLPITGGSAIL